MAVPSELMSGGTSRRQVLGAAAASSLLPASVRGAEAEDSILDPDLAIVDPHHHLWDFPSSRYLFPDLLKDLNSGHRIDRTVFVECQSMYRAEGPDALKPVGEVEFVNGAAAMSASGKYGSCRVAAGIVGRADLSLGARAEPVLEALMRAGGDRFRGIRDAVVWDAAPLYGGPFDPARKDIMANPAFREGFARLKPFGLSFEGWCLHPQLGALAALADAFPDTAIVLNHLGTPLGIGPYGGKRRKVFAVWRPAMVALSKRPNVVVKLGGLGMAIFGSPLTGRTPRPSAAELAADWRPYVETAITAFGPGRCMFESNFPVDGATCDYRTIWNAFKIIAAGASPSEKKALFHDTAQRIYRL